MRPLPLPDPVRMRFCLADQVVWPLLLAGVLPSVVGDVAHYIAGLDIDQAVSHGETCILVWHGRFCRDLWSKADAELLTARHNAQVTADGNDPRSARHRLLTIDLAPAWRQIRSVADARSTAIAHSN